MEEQIVGMVKKQVDWPIRRIWYVLSMACCIILVILCVQSIAAIDKDQPLSLFGISIAYTSNNQQQALIEMVLVIVIGVLIAVFLEALVTFFFGRYIWYVYGRGIGWVYLNRQPESVDGQLCVVIKKGLNQRTVQLDGYAFKLRVGGILMRCQVIPTHKDMKPPVWTVNCWRGERDLTITTKEPRELAQSFHSEQPSFLLNLVDQYVSVSDMDISLQAATAGLLQIDEFARRSSRAQSSPQVQAIRIIAEDALKSASDHSPDAPFAEKYREVKAMPMGKQKKSTLTEPTA